MISFHSLEDRIVKRFLRAQEHGCTCPPDFPVCACGAQPVLRAIPRRAIRPSAAEVARNPRSQSARLRVAVKLGYPGLARPPPPTRYRRGGAARRGTDDARSARQRRARTRRILWIAVSAVLLAGVVFVNVAVLRLNLESTRRRSSATKLRAENAALQSQLSSRLASPRIQALARTAGRPRRRPIPRRSATSTSRAEPRRARSRPIAASACCSRSSSLVFAAIARAGGLAAGRRGGRSRSMRAEPAPRDADDPGRPRDDLRPHRRPARDRRADDDGLRRPAAGARTRAPSRCAAHDVARRRRRTRSTRRSLDKKQRFVYVAALRRSRQGRAAREEAASPGSASTPRSGAPIRSTRRGAGDRLRGRRQRRPRRASSSSTTSSSRGRPGTQTIVRDPFGRTIDVISSPPEQRGRRHLH